MFQLKPSISSFLLPHLKEPFLLDFASLADFSLFSTSVFLTLFLHFGVKLCRHIWSQVLPTIFNKHFLSSELSCELPVQITSASLDISWFTPSLISFESAVLNSFQGTPAGYNTNTTCAKVKSSTGCHRFTAHTCTVCARCMLRVHTCTVCAKRTLHAHAQYTPNVHFMQKKELFEGK